MPGGMLGVGRYYDPATSQFLSVDPLVQETGQPYGYADENPAELSDPSGLWSCLPGPVFGPGNVQAEVNYQCGSGFNNSYPFNQHVPFSGVSRFAYSSTGGNCVVVNGTDPIPTNVKRVETIRYGPAAKQYMPGPDLDPPTIVPIEPGPPGLGSIFSLGSSIYSCYSAGKGADDQAGIDPASPAGLAVGSIGCLFDNKTDGTNNPW